MPIFVRAGRLILRAGREGSGKDEWMWEKEWWGLGLTAGREAVRSEEVDEPRWSLVDIYMPISLQSHQLLPRLRTSQVICNPLKHQQPRKPPRTHDRSPLPRSNQTPSHQPEEESVVLKVD